MYVCKEKINDNKRLHCMYIKIVNKESHVSNMKDHRMS